MYERTFKDKRILVSVNITDTVQPNHVPEKYKDDKIIFSTNHSSKKQLTPYGLTIVSNCNLKF